MERNPSDTTTESSLLAKPLYSLTKLCCRNAVAVLVLSIFAAIFSVYWASEHLGFKMSRLDLINPESGFNRLWLDYIEEFGDSNEVIVVVEGKGNAEVIPVLETLSSRIESFPSLFEGVLHGVDISTIRKKGLHYVPVKELEVVEQFARESAQITKGHWEYLGVANMLNGTTQRLQNTQDPIVLMRTLRELDALSLSLSKAFAASPSYGSPWPDMQGPQSAQAPVPDVVAACSQNDTSYFLFPTQKGVIGFVLLKLANIDKTQMTQGKEGIDKLRSIIDSVREGSPTVHIGLTGMPIIENDEMQLSNDAMTKATILAFIGVGAIFMAGFGGIRHPLLGMIALLVAFAWTMGYITFSVGHLNILSISFGAMLIGLGTDFSVHYVARYLQYRREGLNTEAALCQTALIVGPGVLIGAITTALAFYAASFTEFTGIAELGTISGGGIVLCAFSTFVLLPAMIQLMDGNRKGGSFPVPMDIRPALFPVFRFPATILMLMLAGSVFLLFGVPKVWYDHNLLHLQPEGLESVELEQRLLDMDVDKGGKNVWFALSIAGSKEELLERKKLFAERYPELTVEEIVSWFPEADKQKVPLIESLAKNLDELPERPLEIAVPDPTNVAAAIGRLQHLLMDPRSPVRQLFRGQVERLSGIQIEPEVDMQVSETFASMEKSFPLILKRLAETRESMRRLGQKEYQVRMAQYQSAMAGDLLTRLRTLREMAIPEAPTINDLPESLTERFVSRGGKHLMRIYTTANIWNMDEMKQFVQAVRDIDPKATGSPLQTYESSLQMQQGFVSAAFYALAVIVLFVYLDFRSVKDTLISLAPMLIGFLLMFGVLGWLDIPLNPANMIVLPLILGIGIDDGLHIIHDFRAQKGRYRITSSTATAVLITSLTTFVGFGSMMTASHRGLQSLGRVLVIGVLCCMITSLVMLPAILAIWTRNRNDDSNLDPEKERYSDYEPEKCSEDQTVEYVIAEFPSDNVSEEYVFEQNLSRDPEPPVLKFRNPKRLSRRISA